MLSERSSTSRELIEFPFLKGHRIRLDSEFYRITSEKNLRFDQSSHLSCLEHWLVANSNSATGRIENPDQDFFSSMKSIWLLSPIHELQYRQHRCSQFLWVNQFDIISWRWEDYWNYSSIKVSSARSEETQAVPKMQSTRNSNWDIARFLHVLCTLITFEAIKPISIVMC